MDLTARVTALEEEVSLLKGEIKTILQELRTAVLSQENPFAWTGMDVSTSASAVEAPAAHADAAYDSPNGAPNASNVVRIYEAPAYDSMMPPSMNGWSREHAATAVAEAIEDRKADNARRWSVHSLAALMSWTKESAGRFNETDLGLILALARYGRLIDTDLEGTLTTLAQVMAPDEVPPTASSTDFLLALRQLDALLDEANAQAEKPARRAS